MKKNGIAARNNNGHLGNPPPGTVISPQSQMVPSTSPWSTTSTPACGSELTATPASSVSLLVGVAASPVVVSGMAATPAADVCCVVEATDEVPSPSTSVLVFCETVRSRSSGGF